MNPYDLARDAYAADLVANPTGPDGQPRPRWPLLSTIERTALALAAEDQPGHFSHPQSPQ